MSDTLTGGSIDGLSLTSRFFYERTVVKTILSLIYAGFAIMFLGFCSESGGLSAFNSDHSLSTAADNVSNLKDGYNANSGGFGKSKNN